MSTPFARLVAICLLFGMVLGPGGVLAAPSPQAGPIIHVVQKGETLDLIASYYGITVEDIIAANQLAQSEALYPGQTLVIPVAQPPITPAAGQTCVTYYTVQPGDRLGLIAWRFGVAPAAVMQVNQLTTPDVYPGQVLCIPPGGLAPTASATAEPAAATPALTPLPSPTWPSTPELVVPVTPTLEYPPQVPTPIPPPTVLLPTPMMPTLEAPLPAPTLALPPTPVPAPAWSAAGYAPYRIAFARWDGGKYDLYLAHPNGREQLLLERAAGPSWSPDGQFLAFFGAEGVDRQERFGMQTAVYEGITNGVIVVPVTFWPVDLTQLQLFQIARQGTARAAAWSPNGRVIAWDARPGGRDYRIYFYGQPGTPDEVQSAIEIPGEQPDWSPDGNRIVYRSGRHNQQGIWISNRDDSNAHRITQDGSDALPRWARHGQLIAFSREVAGNVDVYTMYPDGSNVRRLTNAPGHDTLPAWTPDGRIVFRSARTGSWAIYVMNADGSGQTPVIANADPGPDWAFGRMDVR